MGRAPSSSSSRTRPAPIFVSVSFVGAHALAREFGAASEGVVVSQVVPFSWDTSLKVVADYQSAQKGLDPGLSPGFGSFRAVDRL